MALNPKNDSVSSTEIQISVSNSEIMTAVAEELTGMPTTSADFVRFVGYVKQLRVTVLSTAYPLNVRFCVPDAETITSKFLQKAYVSPPLADIECYPTPIKYPSVSYQWPDLYKVYRSGAGTSWFKIGSQDFVLAMITIPGVPNGTQVSLLLSYDVRYRWAECPFTETEIQPANVQTIASIQGWSEKFTRDIQSEAAKELGRGLTDKEKASYRSKRSANAMETVPSTQPESSCNLSGSLSRLNVC